MNNSLPFFGDPKIDAVAAFIFCLTGLWMVLKYGQTAGWVIMAVGGAWVFFLFFR